jgi:hypothetical protein
MAERGIFVNRDLLYIYLIFRLTPDLLRVYVDSVMERNHFPVRRKSRKPRKDHQYKDGRQYVAKKTQLRQFVFERSGGRCENMKRLYHPEFKVSVGMARCENEITLNSMHLAHGKHGQGFRNDVPRTPQNPDGCIAACEDCHRNGDHGSKCTYPRRPGKIMNAKKAQEYWRGTICFCSTLEQEIMKPADTSFCETCIEKLPAALRHDIENTEADDYLKTLAECETAIMQWNVNQVAGAEQK